MAVNYGFETILAIDPGNTESAFALINMPDFQLLKFGKVENEILLQNIEFLAGQADHFAIEMVASYGMPVGKDVFETCVWIGRFIQKAETEHNFVYRKDEKICLCGSLKAKDGNIRQALIDRYAKFDFKNGKGTKKNPDTFYGVSKDVWQAVAVAVTHYERKDDDNA
jgi:hypothetical protein